MRTAARAVATFSIVAWVLMMSGASATAAYFQTRTWMVDKKVHVGAPPTSTLELMSVETTGTAKKITVTLDSASQVALTLYDKAGNMITRDRRPLESIVGPNPFYGKTFVFSLSGEQSRYKSRLYPMSVYVRISGYTGLMGVVFVGPVNGRLGVLR